jgi:predicted nucleic acid-binding protein
MPSVVVDTGPLVAYFDRDDHDHAAVHAWFAGQARKHRLFATEAVVTEVTHMLDFSVPVQTAFLVWASLSLTIVAVPAAACVEIAEWMNGYANVPMDFADATVLWLYRHTPGSKILTLDERGFGVFRLPGQPRRRPAVVALG